MRNQGLRLFSCVELYFKIDIFLRIVGTDKETLGGSANEKFVYLLQNIPYKKERAGLSTGVMKKET